MIDASVTRPPLRYASLVEKGRKSWGTSRDEVITMLGQPQKKALVFHPPRMVTFLFHSYSPGDPPKVNPVARYDEYVVSGLVQFPGDSYEWPASDSYHKMIQGWWDVPFVGMYEVIALPFSPFIATNLALLSMQRYRLGLWYDASMKLIAYERWQEDRGLGPREMPKPRVPHQ